MTYADRLAYFGLWYRQLWAESLGKDGTGTTPIRAMGTADHHSQLQLYLAGPVTKCSPWSCPTPPARRAHGHATGANDACADAGWSRLW